MKQDKIKGTKLPLQNNGVRAILITTDNYCGLEEWYISVFKCPKCITSNPITGTKFCRGCGVPVKMSKTVSDYNKVDY